MGCLYKISSPSGKSYIGISTGCVLNRWDKHKTSALSGRKGALAEAIRKYKTEAFNVTTLVVADDWNYLCSLEKAAISAFNTKLPYGYNLTDGGEGLIGYEFTDEARQAVSLAQKTRYSREDQRIVLIEQAKRANLAMQEASKARRINGKTPWQVRAEAKRSRMGSHERSKKISDAVKAAWINKREIMMDGIRKRDPERMRAAGLKNIGRKNGPASDARKQLIRERQLAAWSDPERRRVRIASMNLKAQMRKAKNVA